MVLNKRRWGTIAVLVAILTIGSWLLMSLQQNDPVLASEDVEKKTISVSGTGEVTVEPDVAYVTLGVISQAETAEKAQEQNAVIMDQLYQVLKEDYKLEDSDIKTTSFYVNPQYVYEEGKEPTIQSYQATHNVQVTYRELDRIGELLDAASKAGINQINQVQFASEHAKEYELEAMKQAMANAREKAEVLAAAEGQTIKSVIQINQNSYVGNAAYSNRVGYAMDTASEYSRVSTSISAGEVVISAQVQVVYEF